MSQLVSAAVGKPDEEDDLLASQADTEGWFAKRGVGGIPLRCQLQKLVITPLGIFGEEVAKHLRFPILRETTSLPKC